MSSEGARHEAVQDRETAPGALCPAQEVQHDGRQEREAGHPGQEAQHLQPCQMGESETDSC